MEKAYLIVVGDRYEPYTPLALFKTLEDAEAFGAKGSIPTRWAIVEYTFGGYEGVYIREYV